MKLSVGPAFVLFIVFLILQLTEVISWSWWWVTAPLWVPTALMLVVLALAGLVRGAVYLLSTPQQRHAQKVADELRKMGARR